MANRKSPTSTPENGKVTPISGAASREGVDGERSDSNSSRIPPAEASNSNPPNGRDDAGGGGREEEARSVTQDRGVSTPTRVNATGPAVAFAADGNILQAIATRFNEARELSKNGAWRQLQTDLMNASPWICPHLIPYKDLLSAVADIEKEIKGASIQAGKSNEELLSEFLNGEGGISVGGEEVLDKDDKVEGRDGSDSGPPVPTGAT